MKKQFKGLKNMNKVFRISLMAISLVLISCEIPENLNDNPKEITVSDVDANLFLNGAQLANVIVQVSHLNRISGMYSGQLIGYTSLYSNIHGYSLSTVESNGEWNAAYIGVVANTRHIQANAPDDKLLVGITQVLEAHAISSLAILMGDVPFSEVLTDKEAPKFDSQKAALDGCDALLSDAITTLSGASCRSEAYDIYYNGDKDKWIPAAYTLKERIATLGGADIDIVAVTKGFGAWAIALASDCGFRMVGENYAQDLAAKWLELDLDMEERKALQVHFIGGMQTNKVRKVADIVSVWQTIDRLSLIKEIAKRGPGSSVMIQVKLTDVEGQGGCDLSQAEELVVAAKERGLRVVGVMGVGPQGDVDSMRAAYKRLVSFADDHQLKTRSIGMTNDLEVAIESGSTMVRIGTALFGDRPSR